MPFDGEIIQENKGAKDPKSRPKLIETTIDKQVFALSGKIGSYRGGGVYSDTHYERWADDERIGGVLLEAGRNVYQGKVRFHSVVPGLAYDYDKWMGSCIIPSVASKYYNQMADQVGAWHRLIQDQSDELGFMTLHAIPARVPWEKVPADLMRDILGDSAKALSKMCRTLRDRGWTDKGYEVILRRTELSISDDCKTVFPHYHPITSNPRSGKLKTAFTDAVREIWTRELARLGTKYRAVFGGRELATALDAYLNAAGVEVVEAVKAYVSKPVEVPKAASDDLIIWLDAITKGRPQMARFGSLKTWVRKIEKEGGRIQWVGSGYRIMKPDRKGDDEDVLDGDQEPAKPSEASGAPEDQEGRQEAAEELRERHRGRKIRNIYCGASTPTVQPDGVYRAHILVSNPVSEREALHYDDSDRETDARVYEEQMRLQWLEEQKTGKAFDLDRFFRPISERLLAWSSHPDRKYRSRLHIAPPHLERCKRLVKKDAEAKLGKRSDEDLGVFKLPLFLEIFFEDKGEAAFITEPADEASLERPDCLQPPAERAVIRDDADWLRSVLTNEHGDEHAAVARVGSDPPF